MVTSVRPQRCQPFPFSLITISLITFRFVSLPSIFPSTLYPPLPFIPLSDWVWPMRPPLHDPGGPRPPSVIPHRPDTSQMPSEALPPQIYLQQCTGGACAGPFPRNAQQVQKPTPLPLSDLPQGIFLQFHLQCSHEDAYWREALWGKKGGEVCVCVCACIRREFLSAFWITFCPFYTRLSKLLTPVFQIEIQHCRTPHGHTRSLLWLSHWFWTMAICAVCVLRVFPPSLCTCD